MFKTGGGPCPKAELSSNEEKIYSLIAVSVDGLEARFDDDKIDIEVDANISTNDTQVYNQTQQEKEIVVEDVEIMVENLVTDNFSFENSSAGPNQSEQNIRDWTNWNPSQLKRKMATPLAVKKRKKISRPEAVEKVTLLAQSKKELIDLQVEAIKKDMLFNTLTVQHDLTRGR